MHMPIVQRMSQGLHAVARFFMNFAAVLTVLTGLIRSLIRGIFGSWSYQVPAWLGWSFHFLRNGFLHIYGLARAKATEHPRRAKQAGVGIVIAGIVLTGAYIWYESLPKPVEASFSISSPGRTRIEDPRAKPDPLVISFSSSVAPIERIGKEVSTGVEISPKVEGIWRWVGAPEQVSAKVEL